MRSGGHILLPRKQFQLPGWEFGEGLGWGWVSGGMAKGSGVVAYGSKDINGRRVMG